MPFLGMCLSLLAMLPLPVEALLGNNGDLRLALLPLLVMVVSCAYVFIVAIILKALTTTLGALKSRRWRYSAAPVDEETPVDPDLLRHPSSPVTVGRVLSMCLVSALVAFVVPYQVAYVVFLADFLWSCSMFPSISTEATAQRDHALALLLILLPLQAPVLPVWVRTLLTAGYTAPFDGDHNVLSIIPMMILVGFSPPNPRALLWEGRRLNRCASRRIIL